MLVGCVPLTKSSLTGLGQYGPGSRPVGAQTVACTSPSGSTNAGVACPSAAAAMASCQIGPAPSTPDTSIIGEPSALPTHTPIAIFGVKPSVQLSRKPELVPLFAAAGNGSSKGVW